MIVLIAVLGRNRVIGVDGGLPWHLPDDLRRFKALTMGTPMIMGRATYDSIGRPLPGRTNIVITRNASFSVDGVVAVSTPGEALVLALREARDDGDISVIGGGQIYRQFLPMAGRLELTMVDDAPQGDTTFPELVADQWVIHHESIASGQPTVTYRTLVRRSEELTSL